MHSNLECIKYDINMGVSRKIFPEKKSKCGFYRRVGGGQQVFYVHTVKNNWKGGGV